MKILLAEQSRVVSFALGRLLGEKGYEVESVYDGVQALDRMQNDSFDLLIVEIDLPRIDGRALVKSAKSRGVHVPTIGILPTSEVTKEDLAESEGPDALLPKPYFAKELLSLINTLAGKERVEASPVMTVTRR